MQYCTFCLNTAKHEASSCPDTIYLCDRCKDAVKWGMSHRDAHFSEEGYVIPTSFDEQEHFISDDDLCSSCVSCVYRPGENSSCVQGWPCKWDQDGYAEACDSYIKRESDDEDPGA